MFSDVPKSISFPNVAKVLGSDLIRHVMLEKLFQDITQWDIMKLIEPFKTYLQTKGVEIDMAEVKRISD